MGSLLIKILNICLKIRSDLKYNLTDLEVEIGKMLGIDDNRIKELDLAKEKNKLFNKAFKMRENGETISQEEADKLNNLLYCIQSKLELCSDYDMAIDYIIILRRVKDRYKYKLEFNHMG